jgi:TRAP-type C4-dicarboxylate transport system permease small subunit
VDYPHAQLIDVAEREGHEITGRDFAAGRDVQEREAGLAAEALGAFEPRHAGDLRHRGISGGAEIVRHLLLWVAFLGAAMAAREGKHIRIDIAQRVLPPGLRNIADVLTGMFTTVVCGLLLFASIQFIRTDYGLSTTIPFFNLPIWILELVIPAGYAAVMLRYAAHSVRALVSLVKGV